LYSLNVVSSHEEKNIKINDNREKIGMIFAFMKVRFSFSLQKQKSC